MIEEFDHSNMDFIMTKYLKTNMNEYVVTNPLRKVEQFDENGTINFNDQKHCNPHFLLRKCQEELWELKGKQSIEKPWETYNNGMEYVPLIQRQAMAMSQSTIRVFYAHDS